MYERQSDPSDYPEHQLVPVKGGRYTQVFHGPPGTDVGDLHSDVEPVAERTDDGTDRTLVVVHSGWLPSDEQIKMLEAGGHVRLSVWAYPIPPLAVSIEPPVCSCHEEAMQWDDQSEGWLCSHVTVPQPKREPDWVEESLGFTPEPPQGSAD